MENRRNIMNELRSQLWPLLLKYDIIEKKVNEPISPSPSMNQQVNEPESDEDIMDIDNNGNTVKNNNFKTFPECFKETSDFTKPTKVPIVHHIEFEENYKYKQPFIYRINVAYHEKVKNQLADLEKKGIIEIGTSEFAAPLCVVPKANTSDLRLCGDFRAINLCTRPDLYPLPRIDEIKQKVQGYIFSVLDLKDGFYQIPIHPEDKHKTVLDSQL